jgi:hypothetical protein
MHLLYLWYEKEPERAVELLDGLRRRHPHNPHFPQAVAGILDVYLHDGEASLHTWEALFDAAQAGRVGDARLPRPRPGSGCRSSSSAPAGSTPRSTSFAP